MSVVSVVNIMNIVGIVSIMNVMSIMSVMVDDVMIVVRKLRPLWGRVADVSLCRMRLVCRIAGGILLVVGHSRMPLSVVSCRLSVVGSQG